MPYTILLLSGPICAGKSSIAKKLSDKYNAHIFKTNRLLESYLHKKNKSITRSILQKEGESLDEKTNGKWVSDALFEKLNVEEITEGIIIVDSIRIIGQAHEIRKAFGGTRSETTVYHLHLTSENRSVLERRYKRRSAKSKISELKNYADLSESKTEKEIDYLSNYADILIKTDRVSENDVFERVCAHLNLYNRTVVPLVDVLIGGQYGSEGKGHIASYLSTEYDYLVRVGGPNAGHKVFEKPEPYTFHILPSGTGRNESAKIILGPGIVINLERLRKEINFYEVEVGRLFIDEQAMIIEESDPGNEAELVNNISSTGQGVGYATARRIMYRGVENKVRLARDIMELKHYVCSTANVFEDAYSKNSKILLEGTQGTSLSLYHGQYPFVTSRDTTVAGCISEAGISPRHIRKIIMVCRTYPIRVGGPSGPMNGVISKREISRRSNIPYSEIKKVERTSTTGRPRRISEFDWLQLKKSIQLNGPTDIAITFADYFGIENRDARRFEQLNEAAIEFIQEIEIVSGVSVSLISTRFEYRSIIDRRAW